MLAPLPRHRRGEAAALLARAFRDNPLNRAVVPGGDSRRVASNRAGMHATLASALRHGTVLAASAPARNGPLLGVLVGSAPEAWPLPLPPWPERLRCLLVQGPRVAARWRDAAESLQLEAPHPPGFVLATLGVAPAVQGRGVGSHLLEAWLAQVDAAGGGTYLETDEPRNLAFYTRAGFRVARELRIFGVPVWTLERRARRGPESQEPRP